MKKRLILITSIVATLLVMGIYIKRAITHKGPSDAYYRSGVQKADSVHRAPPLMQLQTSTMQSALIHDTPKPTMVAEKQKQT